MDERKPKGLKGLLYDNRDSLSYWTFWDVIIFGATSAILAFLAVVLSAVQTWATVEALHRVGGSFSRSGRVNDADSQPRD